MINDTAAVTETRIVNADRRTGFLARLSGRRVGKPVVPAPVGPRPINHWLRVAVIAWAVLVVILTVKGLVQPTHRSVYPAFTAGARDFWNYDEAYGREGFYYGPVFALMMAPFALLPDPIGAMLWNWANTALFLFALVRFHREIIAPRWPGITLAPFLLLTMIGSARGLYAAQSNATIVAMIMLAAVEIVHRRWWRAAFCLGLPVHMKVWPLAAAALLAVRNPRVLAPRLVVAILVLAATPLITHSPDYVARYYGKWQACLAERQAEATRWPGYRDGWTLWETTVGPVDKHVYTGVQLGLAALVCAWCVAQRVKQVDERTVLMGTLALWASWQMLLGPGSERLSLAILAPASAWVLLECYRQRQGRVLVTIAFVLMFLAGTGEVERRLLPVTPWANAALPAGVALFMLIAAWPKGAIASLLAQVQTRRGDEEEVVAPALK